MRVVTVDPDLKAGRKLAASVEQLLPSADVLLYAQPDEALTGIKTHSPDVAFVAPDVNGVAGPEFLAKARDVSDGPKYVGIVDKPDADARRGRGAPTPRWWRRRATTRSWSSSTASCPQPSGSSSPPWPSRHFCGARVDAT